MKFQGTYKKGLILVLGFLLWTADGAHAQGKAYWTCTDCSVDNQRSCILVKPDPVEGEKIIEGSQIRQACAIQETIPQRETRNREVKTQEPRRANYYCTSQPNTVRRWGFAGCSVIGNIGLIGDLCHRDYYHQDGVLVYLRKADDTGFLQRMNDLDTCNSQARNLNGQ